MWPTETEYGARKTNKMPFFLIKEQNTIFCLPRDTGQAQIWLLFIHVPNLKMGNSCLPF
jgi:hypothetical protein